MKAEIGRFDRSLLDQDFYRVSIDSRQTVQGDLFFAFSQPDYRRNCFNGDFADSTVYVPSAFERGAVAAVVRPDRFQEHKAILNAFSERLIFVEDVIYALQLLAKGVYEEWGKRVVGITGSAGKTTAKEITARVLSSAGFSVLSNEKNYNNNIGHPLTVLRLLKENFHDVAVLEMAMSTPHNEIARLCRITPPDVAVVLNVLPVHIEHLGSIENIAKAKAEIVEGMKSGGVAVLNADDERVSQMRRLSKGDVLTFGIEKKADVSAEDVISKGFEGTNFKLVTPKGKIEVLLPLGGRHNIMNALAASAVALVFGLSLEQIATGLSKVTAVSQRGEVLRFKEGFIVINDSYNSNPDSLISMVKTLVENATKSNRKIVVAGEMLELGDAAKQVHYETGAKIASAGINLLIGVRNLAEELVKGAKDAGLENAIFVEDSEKAAELLLEEIRQSDAVLIKGSRGVRMEKIVEKLLERFSLD
ncbi:MAG: UDP-N-acetylmuramoyl-tripeptide--D-alanyl-D-alanine ligase [Pyrinomonadaceae bacterium]|nr:UDP-N-acetylmuramoyl-tripeptide--D-alanyl-D-alanine ligase [Pyrinomonadaceae bacterium]MCX7639774.1 UDP-N-acetylmuramoyl-tripeptide--D-alanyl-D-alanine ligase [Pyrinomonadaceae bacterium]MDW8304357.1 UDP-N-acetylmuramoyl-tripeptide--D-alanyl-D-alanine ligase [Acidobacteriota bacterium]